MRSSFLSSPQFVLRCQLWIWFWRTADLFPRFSFCREVYCARDAFLLLSERPLRSFVLRSVGHNSSFCQNRCWHPKYSFCKKKTKCTSGCRGWEGERNGKTPFSVEERLKRGRIPSHDIWSFFLFFFSSWHCPSGSHYSHFRLCCSSLLLCVRKRCFFL